MMILFREKINLKFDFKHIKDSCFPLPHVMLKRVSHAFYFKIYYRYMFVFFTYLMHFQVHTEKSVLKILLHVL